MPTISSVEEGFIVGISLVLFAIFVAATVFAAGVAVGRAELEEELAEYEASFDLYNKACLRGVYLWREAKCGRELKQPGTAELVAWLLEQLDP